MNKKNFVCIHIYYKTAACLPLAFLSAPLLSDVKLGPLNSLFCVYLPTCGSVERCKRKLYTNTKVTFHKREARYKHS